MKKPSHWTNFQDYLGVNQDQAQGMADRVANNVTATAGAAQNQLTDTKARFGAAVSEGSKDPSAGKNVTSSFGAGDAANQAGYKGPTDFAGFDPSLAGSVADAVKRVGQAGTSAGQQQILGQEYGAGRGSSGLGGGMLDAALLSGVDHGSTMHGLQSKYGGLGRDYQSATGEAADAVTAGQATGKAQKDAWTKLQGQLLGNEQKDLADSKKMVDDAGFEANWQAAMSHDLDDTMNSNFESFNDVMNPITQIAHATGNRDPVQDWGTNMLTPHSGDLSGGGSRKIWWKPRHKEVYRQMDTAQWAKLRSLPQAAQARWLDQRAQEIASGSGPGNFDATKDFGKNAFYGWNLGGDRAPPKSQVVDDLETQAKKDKKEKGG